MWEQQIPKLSEDVGKYNGKITHSKSKFDVFDIREDYSLNIQNLMNIYLLGFSTRLWEKSLEISRNFSMGPLFSNIQWTLD